MNFVNTLKITSKFLDVIFSLSNLKNILYWFIYHYLNIYFFILFFQEIFNAVKYLISTEEKKKNIQIDNDYKNFLCTFLTNAIGNTLADYYLKDEKISKEKVIHYYSITAKFIVENIGYNLN